MNDQLLCQLKERQRELEELRRGSRAFSLPPLHSIQALKDGLKQTQPDENCNTCHQLPQPQPQQLSEQPSHQSQHPQQQQQQSEQPQQQEPQQEPKTQLPLKQQQAKPEQHHKQDPQPQQQRPPAYVSSFSSSSLQSRRFSSISVASPLSRRYSSASPSSVSSVLRPTLASSNVSIASLSPNPSRVLPNFTICSYNESRKLRPQFEDLFEESSQGL